MGVDVRDGDLAGACFGNAESDRRAYTARADDQRASALDALVRGAQRIHEAHAVNVVGSGSSVLADDDRVGGSNCRRARRRLVYQAEDGRLVRDGDDQAQHVAQRADGAEERPQVIRLHVHRHAHGVDGIVSKQRRPDARRAHLRNRVANPTQDARRPSTSMGAV